MAKRHANSTAQTLPKRQKAQKLKVRKMNPKEQVDRSFRRLGAEEPDKREREQLKRRLTKAAKKSQGGLAQKLDRAFGPNETITPRQAAILAESEGLPGKTYAQIAKGESGYRPGAANPDDGYESLWQMTPSVQSSATVKKWNKIASKRPGGSTNPIVAAKQARVLAGGGTGVGNYFGTGFVTDPDAHLPGGQERARKLLYGSPKPIPAPLKRKAVRVLGPKTTKKVVKKAKQVSQPKQLTPPPAKELHRWVQLTESKAEQGAEQGVKAKRAYKVTIRNMLPEMQRALVALGKRTGVPVRVNEGYRTTKRANEFPSGTASQHHQGNAVDVDNNADYTAADLAAVGLNNNSVPGEPWHFQLDRPMGSVASVSGAPGGSVSVVPGTSSSSVSTAVRTANSASERRRKRRKRRKKTPVLRTPARLNPKDYQVALSQEPFSEYAKQETSRVEL